MIDQTLLTKKTVFLFDFDGTIFDTYRLKIDISKELRKYTDNIDLLWETEKKLRHHRYHLVETMRQFTQRIGQQDIQDPLQEMFLHQDFPSYIFPDVARNLATLRQNSILALFTQGDESYQQVKIYQSLIAPVFDFIYIYHNKMAHLQNVLHFFEWKEVWLVDNHQTVLKHAKQQFPKLITVWINREQLSPSSDFTPDFTITSFAQLPQPTV